MNCLAGDDRADKLLTSSSFAVYSVSEALFVMVNFLLHKSDRLCIMNRKSVQAPPQSLLIPIACPNEGLVDGSHNRARRKSATLRLVQL